MKKSSLLLLSVLSFPVCANDVMKALLDHQPTRRSVSSSGPSSQTPEKVGAASTKTLVSGKSCLDLDITEQKSLPLKVINSLIQEEPRKLSVNHNPASGLLEITSPAMISNCNDMIEWKVNQTPINGENAYTVEAKFKQGQNCENGKCKYKVTMMKDESYDRVEEMQFAPNLKGFKECLVKSGVFAEGKSGPDPKAIYYGPINVEAQDIRAKGELLFVSEGPESVQIGPAKGDRFRMVSDCRYIEQIDPSPTILLSQEDVVRARRDQEAEELKNCTVNEYGRVADFLESYEDEYGFLRDVRDKLIKEAAVKSAATMLAGNETEEDWKVFEDFEKYILEPLYEEADQLYAQMQNLSGDEKQKKYAELQAVVKKLAVYGNKPYFEQAHTDKFLAAGKFDASQRMNTARLTIGEYQNLGKTNKGVVVSPESIIKTVAAKKLEYSQFIEKNRESFEIRTGQVTGQAAAHTAAANRLRQNIQIRTRNFTEEIQEEYKRIQPGGYCYAYFRNTQKCIAESTERIQELQFVLQRRNQEDLKRAQELDQKAAEYQKLEAEGRRYIATQNGEAPPKEEDTDALKPGARTEEGSYTFNYNPQAAQQMGMQQPGMQMGMQGFMPQQGMMNPMMNPYGQQSMFGGQNPFMYQQPMMGQMGAYAQFGMQGNYGMNPYMGMQMPMMGGQQVYSFGGQQMGMGQPMMWGQAAMNYPRF